VQNLAYDDIKTAILIDYEVKESNYDAETSDEFL
jgi:hypothetical protein